MHAGRNNSGVHFGGALGEFSMSLGRYLGSVLLNFKDQCAELPQKT